METVGGGGGVDPDPGDLSHALVQLSTRVTVLEEAVLKLTSVIQRILQEKRTLMGKEEQDGEKEVLLGQGSNDSDLDPGSGDERILKRRTRIKSNELVEKGAGCDPTKEDGDNYGLDVDLLEDGSLGLLQYDGVLIDMKSEPFYPMDSQEDGDFLGPDFDGNSENNDDFSQGIEGGRGVEDGGNGIRRSNRTSLRPKSYHSENVKGKAMDHDPIDPTDDPDYQPSEEEEEGLDPPENDFKTKKKLIKILPSSKSESDLPNPYIRLGPKIKKTKKPPPPKRKKSSSTKELPPSDPNGPKRHSCPHCDYSTNFRRKYLEHIRKHTGERPWLCETCGQGFRGKWLLSSHMRSHDLSKPPRPSYTCDLCSQQFKLRVALTAHVNRVHKDQRRQCDLCKAVFSHKNSLYSHKIKVHGEKNAFICEHCGHGFAMATHLKLHVARHSDPTARFLGPKKYPAVIPPSDETLDLDKVYLVPPGKARCEVEGCGKTFGNKILLDYHTRMDHMTEEERRVKCHICHKVYKDILQFRAHMRLVHREERPHACNICGQAFKIKRHLRRHVDGHSKPNWKPRANCKPKTYPGPVAAAPSEQPSADELDCDNSGSGNNSSSSNLEQMEGTQDVND